MPSRTPRAQHAGYAQRSRHPNNHPRLHGPSLNGGSQQSLSIQLARTFQLLFWTACSAQRSVAYTVFFAGIIRTVHLASHSAEVFGAHTRLVPLYTHDWNGSGLLSRQLPMVGPAGRPASQPASQEPRQQSSSQQPASQLPSSRQPAIEP